MSTLPETGLGSLPSGDHITHHEELHRRHNAWETGALIGDVLMATSDSPDPVLQPLQPHIMLGQQGLTLTHDIAGALTIPLTEQVRFVQVLVSANITDIVVTNWAQLGIGLRQFDIAFKNDGASAVTLAYGSLDFIQGLPATTLNPADVVSAKIQDWENL